MNLEAILAFRENLKQILKAKQKQAKKVAKVRVTAPTRQQLEEVMADTEVGKPLMTGVVLPVGETLTLGNEANVYTVEVESPDAAGMRLHFTEFNLPDSCSAYIYCNDEDSEESFGPYTGKGIRGNGEFWSHTISCDDVFVQVEQEEDLPQDGVTYGLNIEEIGHEVRDAASNRRMMEELSIGERSLGACSGNIGCVESGGTPEDTCSGQEQIPVSVADARYAVAGIRFTSNGGTYICSGGLIADSSNSGTPYFLTAHHCIGTAR